MDQPFNKLTVFGALVAGLASFGFAPILVRFATNTPPLVLVTWRTVLAALILLPYWWTKREVKHQTVSVQEHRYVALAGVCLGLHFSLWISSLYYTSIASASVLVVIHPIIVIIVERLWLRRKFASSTWLGVLLAFGGSAMLGIFDSRLETTFTNPLLGNTMAFSAAAIFVVYLFIGQKVRQKRAWIDYVFPVYAYAAATCLILTILFGSPLFDISKIGLLVALGLALGPQILGHGSMNYAIKFISPTLISTLVLAEPLLASVLAVFIFDEIPPLLSVLSMSIILIGIGLTWRKKTPNKKAAELP